MTICISRQRITDISRWEWFFIFLVLQQILIHLNEPTIFIFKNRITNLQRVIVYLPIKLIAFPGS